MSNMDRFFYDLMLSGPHQWNQYRRNHPELGMDPTQDDGETQWEWQHRIKTIVDVDFSGLDFQGLILFQYNLSRVGFSNTDCRNTCFAECDLSGVNFNSAQLNGCQLQSCRLVLTAFEGCDLRNVRFVDCEGVLAVSPQTSFIGTEVLDSQLKYLCFDSLQKDSTQSEFSITEMILQNEILAPTETEVKIAEVRQSTT